MAACQFPTVEPSAPYRFTSRCARRPVERRSSRAMCMPPVVVENPEAAKCAYRFMSRTQRRPIRRSCRRLNCMAPKRLTDVEEEAEHLASVSHFAYFHPPKPSFAKVAKQVLLLVKVSRALKTAGKERTQSLEQKLCRHTAQAQLLQQLGEWKGYDVFELEQKTGRALEATFVQTGRRFGFCGWLCRDGALRADEATVRSYIRQIAAGYYAHSYHNQLHAAEVVLIVQYWLRTCPKLACSPLQQAALLVAAAIHDVGHRALTNDFLVKEGDPLAIRYNDKSVQEHFHVATGFETMRKPGCNILAGMDAEDRKEARKLIIETVLSTDMALHNGLLQELQAADGVPVEDVDKLLLQRMVLHAADIGHPLRPWAVHAEWSRRMMGEFFAQGELEKQRGNAILPMFDREQCNPGNSQVGFINFVVAPTFGVLARFMSRRVSRELSEDLALNTSEWKDIAEDDERCATITASVPRRASDPALEAAPCEPCPSFDSMLSHDMSPR